MRSWPSTPQTPVSASSPKSAIHFALLTRRLTLVAIHWFKDQSLPPHLPVGYRTTLRHLLTYELDISSVPNYSFFEWLAHFCEGEMQERLREFASPAGYVRARGTRAVSGRRTVDSRG